jgi:GAF domain-containing protein
MTDLHLGTEPFAGSASAARVSGHPGSASRLNAFIAAHSAMTSDLSLATLPARIVDATCLALGSASGGIAVLGIDGEVLECTHRGLDDQILAGLRERISFGPGSADQRARQLSDEGFLSVSVRVRGEVFGELYLTPPDGPGRDPHDRELLTALGAVAGTAIENALLHDEAERSKDWLHASGEIARAVLSERSVDSLMEVVSRALHVAEADCGSLILPSPNGMLTIEVAAGVGADDFRGLSIDPHNSLLGQAVMTGESLLVKDMSQVMRPDYDNVHEYGPVMLAPLVDARGVRGAVVLARIRGHAPFSARDLDLATAFADQVALALEMDDARASSEWVTVLEDRHRIAQDLHDNVMQRLFATGVGLQSLAAAGMPPELGRRLGRYIDDLDETIDEIRNRVFGLRDRNGVPLARTESRFPRVAPRSFVDRANLEPL